MSTDGRTAHLSKVIALCILSLLLPQAFAQQPVNEPFPVGDINPGEDPASVAHLTALGDSLFFSADDGTHGHELWRTDAATGEPILVRDIHPNGDGAPQELMAVGDTLFFTADNGAHGRELWKTDGTEAGTTLVLDIYPNTPPGEEEGDTGTINSALPKDFVEYGGLLYFSATDGEHGRELWKSDGTADGTVMVVDLNPGAGGSYAQQMTPYQGLLYFSATDGTVGQELWRTDGTAAGTELVKDIFVGGHASPGRFAVANGLLFFTAVERTYATELWKTDGTQAGTTVVKDIRPDGHSHPESLVASGGLLYFSADDGTHGRELWKSDGTSAGTVMVEDLVDGAFGCFPDSLTAAHGALYFAANEGTSGRELWWSDGSAPGTALVRDIRTPGDGQPRELLLANGLLYFQATDGVHGQELWVSNGSEGGTKMLMDIRAGGEHSSPAQLCVAGERLYFTADDGVNGEELWAYPLPEEDKTPPVITILGSNPLYVEQFTDYTDPGAAATDNVDGDITSRMTVADTVNTSIPSTYTVTYDVTDMSGNTALQGVRTVHVLPSAPPVITLLGDADMTVEGGSAFADPGVAAADNVDGDVTDQVAVTGEVDTFTLGAYTLRYNVSDQAGNAATEVVRTVHVVDTTPPALTRLGISPRLVEQHTVYVDAGAAAVDAFEGDLTANIVTVNPVDTEVPATYTVTYDVSDASGNAAMQLTREVNVLPSEPPVITLLGDAEADVEVFGGFVDPGVTAVDNVDGDLTERVVTYSTVDTSALGTYYIAYNVSDAAGNAAETVLRTINVVDTTPPVISLIGADSVEIPLGTAYLDAGAMAFDNLDGDITANLAASSDVDTETPGTYSVTYTVSDSQGNAADPVSRTVVVLPPPEPDTWYVDITNTGAKDGSSAAPFSSIGEALAAVSPDRGAEIIVRPGVYAETVQLPEDTVLTGESGAYHTWIQPVAKQAAPCVALADGCALRGFTVVGDATATSVQVLADAAADVTNCVIDGAGTGVHSGSGSELTFNNNNVAGCATTGVFLEAGALFADLRNNIFSANGTAISADATAAANGGYNCYHGNGLDLDGPASFPTDFVADPLFINEAQRNFHLLAMSPCRDAGEPDTAWNDLDGSRCDVGADGGPGGVEDTLAPQPVLAASTTSGNAPLTVRFNGLASHDEWAIDNFSWDLDASDGIQPDHDGPVFDHTFTATGTHEVTLTVTDHSGHTASSTQSITVGNGLPTVSADRWPLAGPAPLTVDFTADGEDPDGGAVTYSWQFGAGTSGEQNPQFVYPAETAPGAYEASVEVMDDEGASALAVLPITVTWGDVETAEEIDGTVGGAVSAGDGAAVDVPAGAFAGRRVLSIGMPPVDMPAPGGTVVAWVEFGPANETFSQAASCTLPYDGYAGPENLLTLLRFDESAMDWVNTGISNSVVAEGMATFDTSTLGIFALVSASPRGDVNHDGAVNSVDVQLVIRAALGLDVGTNCDVNGDGQVNSVDVQITTRAALGISNA